MHTMPTLSTDGWVTEPKKRLDRIIAYYLASNPSQTLLFKGRVRSLQNAIREAGNNYDVLSTIIRNDLSSILGNNFPEGNTVDVTYNEISTNGQINVNILANVKDNGIVYDLSAAVNDINSIFVKTTNAKKYVIY